MKTATTDDLIFDVSAGVRPSSGRTFTDERGWYLYIATVESKFQKRRDDGWSSRWASVYTMLRSGPNFGGMTVGALVRGKRRAVRIRVKKLDGRGQVSRTVG